MFLKLRIKIFAKMLYSMYSYLLNMVKYTLVGYHWYLCVEGDTLFETVFPRVSSSVKLSSNPCNVYIISSH